MSDRPGGRHQRVYFPFADTQRGGPTTPPQSPPSPSPLVWGQGELLLLLPTCSPGICCPCQPAGTRPGAADPGWAALVRAPGSLSRPCSAQLAGAHRAVPTPKLLPGQLPQGLAGGGPARDWGCPHSGARCQQGPAWESGNQALTCPNQGAGASPMGSHQQPACPAPGSPARSPSGPTRRGSLGLSSEPAPGQGVQPGLPEPALVLCWHHGSVYTTPSSN